MLSGLIAAMLALIAFTPLASSAYANQSPWLMGRTAFRLSGGNPGTAVSHPAQFTAVNALIWPLSGSSAPDTDRISSPFGPRWQASQNRYDYHPGLDIAAPQGTPVYAVADGIVTKRGWLSTSSGLTVLVYHPSLNLYSAYLHLSATAVNVNDTVTQGQVIGEVGNTGTTEFMHLHFEIRLSASSYPTSTRNPLGYLPRPDLTAPTIAITNLQSDPVYSPTVSLLITATRAELDVNQIRVRLYDRASGALLDNQFVDFNQRLHTGDDTLDKDGIQLRPSHFSTATQTYQLTANFYNLSGQDAFTVTAEVEDLAGHINTVTAVADDLTPPGQVTDLLALSRSDGSVELRWTAPGDSGFVSQAAAYDIRSSNEPINSFVWDINATPLSSPPAPIPGSGRQSWIIPGPFSEPVYFALRATDTEGNLSLLSNSARAQTRLFLPLIAK